jgi:hypothetical protein
MTSFPLPYKLLQTIEAGREDENTIASECRQWHTASKIGTMRNGISITSMEMFPLPPRIIVRVSSGPKSRRHLHQSATLHVARC